MNILFIIIAALGSLLLLMLFARSLFIHFKWKWNMFERFCCFVGWHWETKTTGFDGCSSHGECLSCNQKGMFDGNGDFF